MRLEYQSSCSVLRDHEHETDQRAAAANESRSASWRLDRSALADRPMARYTEDLELAMKLLSGEDEADFTSPPVPLFKPDHAEQKLIAFFTYNGIARCSHEIENAVRECADFFSGQGLHVDEQRPPGIEQACELELALLGADGNFEGFS